MEKSQTPTSPWERQYPPGVTSDLVSPFQTLLEAWGSHLSARPDSPAVHFFDSTLTFAEIDRSATALAAAFRANQVVAGDRIAIYLQNDPQWLVTMLAAWRVGAIPVTVNPMLRKKELLHILTDCGARVLVCLSELYAQVVAAARDETELRIVITTHPLDLTPDATVPPSIARYMADRELFPQTLDWQELMASHSGDSLFCSEPTHFDVGALTYTSGTTGPAKGAMNLQGGMAHNAFVYTRWWSLCPDDDVIMVIAPIFHITGLIAGLGAHILSGAPIVLLHRFDAEQTLRAIERWQGTFMIAASTAFIALAEEATRLDCDVSSLTKTASGGAPVSTALVSKVQDATGWTMRGAYGLTETTSPTHLGPGAIDSPVDPESGAQAVGVPVPGVSVKIVDVSDGHELTAGGVGEIVVSGPMVVPGYWQAPAESAHAIRNGWFHTGDIGKVTDDGWLFVIDRLKDLINAGGYKVYPRDVEDVLCQHPAVREAAVIGVPDAYRGETVKAVVSLSPGRAITPDELIRFCKDRMAAYKYPRLVEIVDALPKNAAGKVLRRELRNV
ncbi:class I adenylate-forming enzyme family protein [Mycobacterium sp. NPDC051198]